MPTAKPTVIIRVKLVLFHFVVIIKVILVFLVEFFHFSDSSNHREDFGFIGRLLFCQFSTFLIILSDSTILIIFKFGLINFFIYFRILQFSFLDSTFLILDSTVLIFGFYSSLYFQISRSHYSSVLHFYQSSLRITTPSSSQGFLTSATRTVP